LARRIYAPSVYFLGALALVALAIVAGIAFLKWRPAMEELLGQRGYWVIIVLLYTFMFLFSGYRQSRQSLAYVPHRWLQIVPPIILVILSLAFVFIRYQGWPRWIPVAQVYVSIQFLIWGVIVALLDHRLLMRAVDFYCSHPSAAA